MPKEIQTLAKSEKQALEIMSKGEWDSAFVELKKDMKGVADQVIAYNLLSSLTPKAKPKVTQYKESEKIQIETLNGQDLNDNLSISIPLWVLRKRQIEWLEKKTQTQRVATRYKCSDKDGRVIDVIDRRDKSPNFEVGSKIYVKDGKTFKQALNIWNSGDLVEVQGKFKDPESLSVFKKLEGRYDCLCCVEGVGLPGDRNFDINRGGTVRFVLVDTKSRSVNVVVYAEIVDKLIKEQKINEDLEKLPYCRMKVKGIYREKIEYSQRGPDVDIIEALVVETVAAIDYNRFSKGAAEVKKPEKVQPPPKAEKVAEIAPKPLSSAILKASEKALKAEMLDEDFMEVLENVCENPDVIFQQLQDEKVISDKGGIISWIKAETPKKVEEPTAPPEKKESKPQNLEDKVEPESAKSPEKKPIPPLDKKETKSDDLEYEDPPSDDEIQICAILKKMDIELEKDKVRTGVTFAELQTGIKWNDAKFKQVVENLIKKGYAIEPKDGRLKPVPL